MPTDYVESILARNEALSPQVDRVRSQLSGLTVTEAEYVLHQVQQEISKIGMTAYGSALV
jgi:hypothetical protein